MKKLMMIAAMALMSMGAFAQAGTCSFGANLGIAGYGDSYNPLGVGIKFQYEFVENMRGEVAYNYWLPKDEAGVMDVDLTFHYLIPIVDKFKVYPLGGINVAMTHGEAFKDALDGQETIFGFQLGCGVEYMLTPNLKANAEAKYQYNKKTKTIEGSSYTVMGYTYTTPSMDYDLKFDGPVFQVGIAYVF